jgi:hypothetical protein
LDRTGVRNGNTLYLFLDGVSQGTRDVTGVTVNNSFQKMVIGRMGGYPQYTNGWIDEFRFSKGIARWTSNFTPPVSEYTPVATPTPTATLTSTPTNTAIYTPTFTPTLTPHPTLTPTPTNSYVYDRNAAIAYADQWAHEPRNSTFSGVLPPTTNYSGCDCANCTDFMSQVLLAGGYPFHGNSPNDWVENWWYTSTNSSLSWRYVPAFKNYFEAHPNEFVVVNQAEMLQAGDIIMLDLHGPDSDDPPDGIYDHVEVVVGYGYTSTNLNDYIQYDLDCNVIQNTPPASTPDILISQNCVDRWRVAWDEFVEPDTGKVFIHVID